MGYIYSYNENYMNFSKREHRKKYAKLDQHFATIQTLKCGSIKVMLSKVVVQEIGLNEWAIVGYDKENKTLYVQPTLKSNGALHVCLSGVTRDEYSRQIIDLTKFFEFCNEKEIKKGRYKANIALDKSHVIIDFNCPIQGRHERKKDE